MWISRNRWWYRWLRHLCCEFGVLVAVRRHNLGLGKYEKIHLALPVETSLTWRVSTWEWVTLEFERNSYLTRDLQCHLLPWLRLDWVQPEVTPRIFSPWQCRRAVTWCCSWKIYFCASRFANYIFGGFQIPCMCRTPDGHWSHCFGT